MESFKSFMSFVLFFIVIISIGKLFGCSDNHNINIDNDYSRNGSRMDR